MTALHLLTIQNDYKMMNQFLNFKNSWVSGPLEIGLKDGEGRNPCDLAIEMGHQQMLDLLQNHGGAPSFSKELISSEKRDPKLKNSYVELNKKRERESRHIYDR